MSHQGSGLDKRGLQPFGFGASQIAANRYLSDRSLPPSPVAKFAARMHRERRAKAKGNSPNQLQKISDFYPGRWYVLLDSEGHEVVIRSFGISFYVTFQQGLQHK